IVDPLIGFQHVIKLMDLLRALVQRKLKQRLDNPPPPAPDFTDQPAQDGAKGEGEEELGQVQSDSGNCGGFLGNGLTHEENREDGGERGEHEEEEREEMHGNEEGLFSDECATPLPEDDPHTPIARPLVPEPLLAEPLIPGPHGERPF
ncbi:unnamed protein product, partial [Closterium sp. NIES-54]